MLFVMGLALGAVLMVLAQRRAETIRLRVERRWGDHRPVSWEGWRRVMNRARHDQRREPC
ncbi:hypothetical protein Rumeso_02533 [Rubellimicrobium mesophilum DSM 19309]|uniref:Uncharacterized protein n=1 Tax=Rubellimicrobium mesophilum DSM 19309 TaxID=442562 RepID=A0A017HNM0_9RHOB|nr:hypothetical protein [Rubellimicrobium mesophilum]EYD75915.1 hypothetical protein Rumeso_02533 [Rubellimicrobium mesophilum DSM 19309]